MEFEEIARQIFDKFVWFVYQLLRKKGVYDEEVAKDLAQDVFLKVFLHKREQILTAWQLPSQEAEKEIKSLVYSAWKDVFAEYYRKKFRRDTKDEEHKNRENIMQDNRDPFEELFSKEVKAKLTKAFLQLPSECRVILYLRMYKDMKYEEIAQTLQLPEGTVKSRISRCKQELRKLIEALYPELKFGL